ncbi:MAG: hypothetical protein HF314_08000 [Ignavibacteria bacterium]|jgi:uncharacterized membrane protein YidH (DUF202 family)|nr:hypothetical protein [Ignavibacteria bacterium]MCU7517016.1 hypothetical protein [Ignavibacteria bacterium]
MENRRITNYLQKTILILIATLPLLYFNQIKNVPLKAFILGAGSWGFGCIFKILAHQIVIVPLHKKNISLFFSAFLNGLLSGIFELLAAYIIILLMKDKFAFDFNAIISFGLAIGAFEIFVVIQSNANNLLKGTSLEKSFDKLIESLENMQGIDNYIFNVLFPVIERIVVTFIHISTRGLIFVTIIAGSIIPALIALGVFIIADGLGYYYHISEKLSTRKGYIQVHEYLFILSVISTIIFLVLINPYRNYIL